MYTVNKAILAVLTLVVAGAPVICEAQSQSKGKVLVVMSSANELALKDGKRYKTGYYLNEVEVPCKKSIEAACFLIESEQSPVEAPYGAMAPPKTTCCVESVYRVAITKWCSAH